MSKKYFSAVIDVKTEFGTRREIARQDNPEVYFDRYFNNKFVDSPEKALAVACDVLNQRNHGVSMTDIMEKVTFDNKTSEYTVIKYFTDNQHIAKESQIHRFFQHEPEFRLFRVEYKIQVFETMLVTDNLINKASELEFPQKTK